MNILENFPVVLPLAIQPWGEKFPSKTEGSVQIEYSEQCIKLEYKVSADEFLGRYKNYMDPVYTDSCAEMFITFDEEHYYNLEFGILGGKLCGCKEIRSKRGIDIPQELADLISVQSELYRECEKIVQCYPPQGEQYSEDNPLYKEEPGLQWVLRVIIPIEFFQYPKIESLKGLSARANFYLCGDDLTKPHYLAWAPIPEGDGPNYHQPQFFKEIKFIS